MKRLKIVLQFFLIFLPAWPFSLLSFLLSSLFDPLILIFFEYFIYFYLFILQILLLKFNFQSLGLLSKYPSSMLSVVPRPLPPSNVFSLSSWLIFLNFCQRLLLTGSLGMIEQEILAGAETIVSHMCVLVFFSLCALGWCFYSI